MINVKSLINLLKKNNNNIFIGVPDSVLKEFSSSLPKNSKNHIIATSEGAAISLGIGHFLATENCQLFICKIQDFQML